MTDQSFGQLTLLRSNLDRFPMRTAVYKSVLRSFPAMKGRLLDVGCGKMPYREEIVNNTSISQYTGIDIQTDVHYSDDIKPHVIWDGKALPFCDQTFDTVLATEVLEHVDDLDRFLSEIYRITSPGGTFIFTVPFLWPLHEVPYDVARYTPFYLEKKLNDSGFVNTQLHATGGWHACLAQMLGLWVRRGITRHQGVLSLLLKPIISLLLRMDKPPARFHESAMILGLRGTASKQ